MKRKGWGVTRKGETVLVLGRVMDGFSPSGARFWVRGVGSVRVRVMALSAFKVINPTIALDLSVSDWGIK